MTTPTTVVRRVRRTTKLGLGVAIGAIALLATVATGCGDDDDGSASSKSTTTAAPGADGLPGTSWVLASYGAGSTPAVAGADATLQFADGARVSGSTGCNNFSGTFTEGDEAGALTIALGPMTMMACTSPELTAQEQAVMANLAATASYTVDGTTLSLADSAEAVVLTYTAVSNDLEGTKWTANGVNNGRDAVEGVSGTEELTAEFGADGKLSGFGGCNNYNATWSTDGSKITISALASTKKACGTEVDQREQQYFTALQAVTTYEVSGSTLNMRDAEGATQVNFARAQ